MTMNIRIKATNVTLSPAISDSITKRLGRLTKLVAHDPSAQCDIELAKTTNHHQKGDIFKAEIHLIGEGIDAYASVEHEDLSIAVTDARDEVLRELNVGRGKRLSYIRRGGAQVKAMVKGLMPWGESGWYRKSL
jgi:ribosomal subunit interface protein